MTFNIRTSNSLTSNMMIFKPFTWLANWYRSHIRHQVFSIISLLMLVVAIGIGVIGWAATEIAADSFINQRVSVMQSQWIHKTEQTNNHAPATAQHIQIYAFEDANKPQFLNAINRIGIEEFELSNAHVATFESPLHSLSQDRPWIHLVYLPDIDPEMVNYGDGVLAYVGYMMLLVMLLGLVTAHIISKRFSAPILDLVEQVKAPQNTSKSIASTNHRRDEIGDLHRAYQESFARIQAFLQREQQFTRFASHELRTPVHIIQGATDLLIMTEAQASHEPASRLLSDKPLAQEATSHKRLQVIQRIQKANREMNELINTFLLIGREEHQQQSLKSILEIIQATIEQHQHLLNDQSITFTPKDESDFLVEEHFAGVVISNLIRNAFSYSHTSVTMSQRGRRLIIENDILEAQAKALAMVSR